MAKRLLFLNGLAVIGVVTNHTLAWVYIAMFWWAHRYLPVASPNFDQLGGATYYFLRVIEQWIAFSIPAFLAVSGYFVAFATRKGDDFAGWKFIGSRIKYLAIPYLIWSLITLGTDYAQGMQFSLLKLVRTLLLGEATQAFYFIPLLIQLYLLTILLTRVARDKWELLLVSTALLQIAVQAGKYMLILEPDSAIAPGLDLLTSGWFFPGNVFWFSAGMVFGFHQSKIKPALQRFRWHLLGLVFVLWAAGVIEWELVLRGSGQEWIGPRETLLDNLYSFTVLAAFIGFSSLKLPKEKTISDLGSKSFGVYLVHSLVLTFTARGIYHLLPELLGLPVLFCFILFLTGLIIPLLLMAIVKRSPLRRAYAYLFG